MSKESFSLIFHLLMKTSLFNLFLIFAIIVSKAMSFNDSETRIPSNVWKQIISDWMKEKLLSNISRVDIVERKAKMGRNMKKKKQLHEHIISIIMDLKMQNYSVLNFQLIQRSDSENLFDQYLLSFSYVIISLFV